MSEWEVVCQEKNGGVSRLRLPYTGWLVQTIAVIEGVPLITTVFVPDHNMKWKLDAAN